MGLSGGWPLGVPQVSYKKFTDFSAPRAAPAASAANSLPAATAAPAARAPFKKISVWHLEDIMALPIMPCTTCNKFKWGRRPSCEKYQRLVEPRTGCRCVHYEARP